MTIHKFDIDTTEGKLMIEIAEELIRLFRFSYRKNDSKLYNVGNGHKPVNKADLSRLVLKLIAKEVRKSKTPDYPAIIEALKSKNFIEAKNRIMKLDQNQTLTLMRRMQESGFDPATMVRTLLLHTSKG